MTPTPMTPPPGPATATTVAARRRAAFRRASSSTSQSVLFDVPGPASRRRTRIGSALALVVIAYLLWVAFSRLQERGQLDGARWEFVTDPDILRFLGNGLLNTLKAAAVAGGLALVIGATLAMGRLAPNFGTRLGAGTWVELWRATPLLLLIYFINLSFPGFGLGFPVFWFLVIALTVYNSAVFAETFRTGVVSLHRGQREAASALGLTYWQSMRLVEFPQAVRRMVPTLVSQFVTLLKDSSLGFVLGYEELLHRGEAVGLYSKSVLQAYVVVAVVYIVVNASLSYLARRLERRADRSHRIPLADHRDSASGAAVVG